MFLGLKFHGSNCTSKNTNFGTHKNYCQQIRSVGEGAQLPHTITLSQPSPLSLCRYRPSTTLLFWRQTWKPWDYISWHCVRVHMLSTTTCVSSAPQSPFALSPSLPPSLPACLLGCLSACAEGVDSRNRGAGDDDGGGHRRREGSHDKVTEQELR